jgi:hypothetical protein
MPAWVKKEQELRKHFEESGLDYDATPKKITKAFLRRTALKVQAHHQKLFPVIIRDSTAPRQSVRSKQKKEKDSIDEVKKLENEFDKLFRQRLKIIKKQDELAERKNHFF